MERENHYPTYSPAFKGDARRQSSKLNRSYFLSHPYESNLDNAKGGKFSRTKASPFLTLQQTGSKGRSCIGRSLQRVALPTSAKAPLTEALSCLASSVKQFQRGLWFASERLRELDLYIVGNYTHNFLHQATMLSRVIMKY